jgi:hypothetical protein
MRALDLRLVTNHRRPTPACAQRYERMYDGQQRRHISAESGRVPTAIVDIVAGMAIARLPLIVIDCPDPGALARFYGAMLDWKIDVSANRASVCGGSPDVQSRHICSGYHRCSP